MDRKTKNKRGFTLIELLVVIAIIGLLATIVLVAVSNTRMKARDVKRASDIKQVQLALEMYYDDYGAYPVAAAWYGGTGNCWGTVTDNWVPGLSPNYITKLPLDPKPTSCGSVYLYASNGVDYKIIAHVPENCTDSKYSNIVDPNRVCWAWAVYTSGAKNW